MSALFGHVQHPAGVQNPPALPAALGGLDAARPVQRQEALASAVAPDQQPDGPPVERVRNEGFRLREPTEGVAVEQCPAERLERRPGLALDGAHRRQHGPLLLRQARPSTRALLRSPGAPLRRHQYRRNLMDLPAGRKESLSFPP